MLAYLYLSAAHISKKHCYFGTWAGTDRGDYQVVNFGNRIKRFCEARKKIGFDIYTTEHI